MFQHSVLAWDWSPLLELVSCGAAPPEGMLARSVQAASALLTSPRKEWRAWRLHPHVLRLTSVSAQGFSSLPFLQVLARHRVSHCCSPLSRCCAVRDSPWGWPCSAPCAVLALCCRSRSLHVAVQLLETGLVPAQRWIFIRLISADFNLSSGTWLLCGPRASPAAGRPPRHGAQGAHRIGTQNVK